MTACGQGKEPILIGFSSQLSGPGSTPSTVVRDGANLMLEQLNAQGGINGRPVELLIKDDRGEAGTALQADEELIKAGVAAIIGHTTSEMSAVPLKLLAEEKLVMLSPASSAGFLMNKDDYFFTLYPSNEQLATEAAAFAYHQLGLRYIAAILDNFNSLYSGDYYQNFKGKFEALGGKMVHKHVYNSNRNTQFRLILDSVLQSEPDGLFVVAASMDTALVVQQLYKRKLDIPVIASDWAAYQELIEMGGPYVEHVYLANLYDDTQEGDLFHQFNKDMLERYNKAATIGAALGYESLSVLIQAMKLRSKDENLKETLLSHSFQGLQGAIQFDEYGDVERPIYIKTVKDGKFVNVDGGE